MPQVPLSSCGTHWASPPTQSSQLCLLRIIQVFGSERAQAVALTPSALSRNGGTPGTVAVVGGVGRDPGEWILLWEGCRLLKEPSIAGDPPLLPSPSLSSVSTTKFQTPAPWRADCFPAPSHPTSSFLKPLTWLRVACRGPASSLSSCLWLSSDMGSQQQPEAQGLRGDLGYFLL